MYYDPSVYLWIERVIRVAMCVTRGWFSEAGYAHQDAVRAAAEVAAKIPLD